MAAKGVSCEMTSDRMISKKKTCCGHDDELILNIILTAEIISDELKSLLYHQKSPQNHPVVLKRKSHTIT